MELRPTSVGDLPALHEVFLAAISGVYRQHGFQPPSPPVDVFTTQQEHVLRTGVSHVAIRDGTITGFASAWSRGDDWFLASLFIAPDAQGFWSAEGLQPGGYSVVVRGRLPGYDADWEEEVDFAAGRTISLPLTRPRFFRHE